MMASMASFVVPPAIADEIALVLIAEGIDAELRRDHDGTVIWVADRDASHAARILAEEYPGGFAASIAERRWQPRSPFGDRWFGRGSWVLFAIVGLCIAIYAGEELSGGSESRAVLLRFGASRPAHVRSGEWWRLVMAIFVHIGPRHILGNVATLLVLAPALAAALGAGRFAFIFVLTGVAGNALSYWVAPSDMVSAGASGAILGVLGALGGQRIRFASSARFRTWQIVAALLAYLGIAVGAEPGVDTMAHLGGLIAGFVLGLVIPPLPAGPTRRERLVSIACGAVAGAIVALAFIAAITASRRA
jgi:rhomboid protease GluP